VLRYTYRDPSNGYWTPGADSPTVGIVKENYVSGCFWFQSPRDLGWHTFGDAGLDDRWCWHEYIAEPYPGFPGGVDHIGFPPNFDTNASW